MRRAKIAFILAALAACPVFGGDSAASPVVRYRVVLRDTVIEPISSVAESLAATVGGTWESDDAPPSTERSFAMVVSPERAALLEQSSAVQSIRAIGTTSSHATHMVSNTSVDLGTYVYDGSGNIKAIGSDRYLYDTVGRLASAQVTGKQQTYGYDAFGNITSMATTAGVTCTGGVACGRGYTISPSSNHITSDGATYDEAGDLLTLSGRTFSYDRAGMLTGIAGSTAAPQYIYTADDQRLATYSAGMWSWTVRDTGGAVLREYTSQNSATLPGAANWNWTEDYVYRDGQLMAAETPQGRRHFHLDHLGTPRLITDDAGHQIGLHTYFPFGAEIDGPVHEYAEDLRKFTGHERDGTGDILGLDYMHARYYGWGSGRFLSVDPVIGEGVLQNPRMWNRYAYVMNNPIGGTDPDGRCPQVMQNVVLCRAYDRLGESFSAVFDVAFAPEPTEREVRDAVWEQERTLGRDLPLEKDYGTEMALMAPVVGALARAGSVGAAGRAGAESAEAETIAPSEYQDITRRGSIANRSTNVTPQQAAENLKASGFAERAGSKGVQVFEKDGLRYTIRATSKSTAGPSMDVVKDGQTLLKIRLATPPAPAMPPTR